MRIIYYGIKTLKLEFDSDKIEEYENLYSYDYDYVGVVNGVKFLFIKATENTWISTVVSNHMLDRLKSLDISIRGVLEINREIFEYGISEDGRLKCIRKLDLEMMSDE